MRILTLILALSIVGCSQVQTVAESESLFVVCKSVDIFTTKVALNSGLFHEVNPALKFLIGPHNLLPLVGFSVGVWALLHYINEPKAWLVANGITCPIAIRNAVLLHGSGIIH